MFGRVKSIVKQRKNPKVYHKHYHPTETRYILPGPMNQSRDDDKGPKLRLGTQKISYHTCQLSWFWEGGVLNGRWHNWAMH